MQVSDQVIRRLKLLAKTARDEERKAEPAGGEQLANAKAATLRTMSYCIGFLHGVLMGGDDCDDVESMKRTSKEARRIYDEHIEPEFLRD